ncbi:hypothetical protein WME76_22305 [Sorangium sp. So ce119]|uniref:hypothetical protein n=1 Tax=Sorangium sp. So ce119 TaxID=3133279 RepID=UPI003F5E60EF
MSDSTDVHAFAQLVLDGVDCGPIHKLEGSGGARSKVASVPHDPLTVHIGVGMGAPLMDWIQSALGGQPTRKSGVLRMAGDGRAAPVVRAFEDARITGITLPACDTAAAQRTALVVVTVSPSAVREQKGDGGVLPAPQQKKLRPLYPSRFKLAIDGLEQQCSRISKVDSLTFEQKTVVDTVGEGGEQPAGSTKLELPHLRITVDAADLGAFRAWYEEFVACSEKGTCGDGDGCRNKQGRLAYLDPAGDELLSLELRRLGVVKVSTGSTASATVEISFESAALKLG